MGSQQARPVPSEENPKQRISVDWNNEDFLNKKSASNSLHNYALGKMRIEDPVSMPAEKEGLLHVIRKRLSGTCLSRCMLANENSHKRKNISFAEDLEQIFEIESGNFEKSIRTQVSEEIHSMAIGSVVT